MVHLGYITRLAGLSAIHYVKSAGLYRVEISFHTQNHTQNSIYQVTNYRTGRAYVVGLHGISVEGISVEIKVVGVGQKKP